MPGPATASAQEYNDLESVLLNTPGDVPLAKRFRALFTLRGLKSHRAIDIIGQGEASRNFGCNIVLIRSCLLWVLTASFLENPLLALHLCDLDHSYSYSTTCVHRTNDQASRIRPRSLDTSLPTSLDRSMIPMLCPSSNLFFGMRSNIQWSDTRCVASMPRYSVHGLGLTYQCFANPFCQCRK